MKINVFSENLEESYEINERKFINVAKKVLKFYLQEIADKSCLSKQVFNTVSFDFVYCNSYKTHEINKEYRNKDYPADIITFAIFADSEEKFIFDGEINLGEVLIALDKVEEEAVKKVAQQYEGGSMQLMQENLEAARLTKERLYELLKLLN